MFQHFLVNIFLEASSNIFRNVPTFYKMLVLSTIFLSAFTSFRFLSTFFREMLQHFLEILVC
jgi:hypothetical protein